MDNTQNNQQPQDVATLTINGVDWKGWKSFEVTRQVDAVCGSFSLGLIDRWQEGAKAIPIAASMPCEVRLNNDVVINGYIDSTSPSFSNTDHGITVAGRDKTGDIVDCSAVHKPGHFRGLNALQLATELAKPFGISVTAEGDVGAPFATFKVEQGETAFDALDRALKQRELLAIPDANGGLVLAKIGEQKAETALEQGKNIIEASATYDAKDRFTSYIVQGQQQASDDLYGEKAAAVAATATDGGIPRYRPLIVRAENQVDSSTAKKRADWEATVRAARSVTVSVTVQGFRQANGALWNVNMLVSVKIPYLYLDQELLISKVTWSRSISGGSVTKMELKDPKAFLPEPEKKEKSKGDGNGNGSSTLAGGNIKVAAEEDLLAQDRKNAESAHSKIKEG